MPFGPNLLILTTGVLPTVSRMFANLAMGSILFYALHVEHASISIQHRFLHHLRQGRGREDGVHQFFFRGFQVHRHHITLDQFGNLDADRGADEELPGLLVEDHFDQALVLAERDGLAVADEGKAADADVDLFILGRLFGQADRGDLRRTISAAGNQQLVHRMRLQALDRLDADHAFVLGLVRQHRGACDVADGVDAGHAGLVEGVDHDAAALGFQSKFFQPEIFDVAGDADSGDHALGGDLLRLAALLDRRGDAVALLVEFGHLGVGQDFDALLLEALARKSLNLMILDRQDLRQHLDHRHLSAERAVERGKLDADGAGADHQQRLRNAGRRHGLKVSPHQFLVRLQAGQHARPRAGGDDDVFGLIGAGWKRTFRRFAFGGLHHHLAGRVDSGFAPDDRHFILFHEKADAVVEPLGHRARTRDHGFRVVADIVGLQPVVLGVLHVMEYFRRAQQRLGGDAAPVQANAAEIVALDYRGLEAELRRADGGDIAAGAGADNQYVEGSVRHLASPNVLPGWSYPFRLPYGETSIKPRGGRPGCPLNVAQFRSLIRPKIKA